MAKDDKTKEVKDTIKNIANRCNITEQTYYIKPLTKYINLCYNTE